MTPKELKILRAVTYTQNLEYYEEHSEIINLCYFEGCEEIAIKKCPKIDSKHICMKHCRKVCNLGVNEDCELLRLNKSIKQFYRDIERFIYHKGENYQIENNFFEKLVDFVNKSLLTVNLWQFQINPEVHDSSMVCNNFYESFLKISKLKIYTNLRKKEYGDISYLFEYLISLEVLNFLEYHLKKYFEDQKIDIEETNFLEIESNILNYFPRLIDCFKCEEPQTAIIFFLNNIFFISKFSKIFTAGTFFNKFEYLQKICLEKIKNKKCSENCRSFVDFKNTTDNIKNDILLFFFNIIRICRYDLLNIGIVHVYNKQTGYGASYNDKMPLKIEKNGGYYKFLNPILKLDKKVFRKKLIPYSGRSLTGRTPQEPFLIINNVNIENKWYEIILRHYYSGIYIPIDINQFYHNPNLIQDIFRGVSYLQEQHPKNISQGTAANSIPPEIFKVEKIMEQFKKIDYNHFTIRDLGGGKGEMMLNILKQLYSKIKKKINLKKIILIDMDKELLDKVSENFQKVIKSQNLDKDLISCLEVYENKNIFKEIFNINEKVKLTIISQVLDMYILVKYNYDPKYYDFSLRDLSKVITQTMVEEGLNLFETSNNNNISEKIKQIFKKKLNNPTYLTDFVLSSYNASIWQNTMLDNSNYYPTKKNIAYERSNEFYGEVYNILTRIFNLSENTLIIDRGVHKDILKDYFEFYEIYDTEVEIKKPFINVNILFIKKNN